MSKYLDGYSDDLQTLFSKRLLEFLTPEQIEKVCQVISEICNECWDSPRGCQCWNDE